MSLEVPQRSRCLGRKMTYTSCETGAQESMQEVNIIADADPTQCCATVSGPDMMAFHIESTSLKTTPARSLSAHKLPSPHS